MKNILVIDADPSSRMQTKAILSGEYQVFETETGDKALDIAKNQKIDLILLDMERPDYEGPEICEALKEDKTTKYTPLILLSSYDQKDHIVNGLHAGAEDYINKPLYANELLARIDTHLRTKDFYADLEKEDLLMLLELTEAISVIRNPKKILSCIVEKMAEALGVARCSIISLNDDNDLVVRASNDLPDNREITLALENYPEIQQALTTQRPVVLQDIVNNPLMAPVREKVQNLTHNSVFVVPIVKKQNVIGTFFLRTASSLKGAISTRVFKLCQLVANISGNALENAILFETMQSSRQLLLDGAQRDSLTGLFNHQQFHTRLEEEFSRARRYKVPLSCIFADIDEFKNVNDRFGHMVGDVVLKRIGKLFQDMFRRSDVPARYGGEEFAVILPNTDSLGVEEFAERLRTMVSELYIPHLKGGHITVSVGVATYVGNNVPQFYGEFLQQADQAMYREKQGKKQSAPSFD